MRYTVEKKTAFSFLQELSCCLDAVQMEYLFTIDTVNSKRKFMSKRRPGILLKHRSYDMI